MADRCYSFEPVGIQRIPRAWERIPKTAFARRRKGRKLWKRQISRGVEVRDLYPKAQDSAPSIKRLRLAHLRSTSCEHSLGDKPSQYFATLLEQDVKTPRRKCTISWVMRAVANIISYPLGKPPQRKSLRNISSVHRVIPNSSTRPSTNQASPVRRREHGAAIASEAHEPAVPSNIERVRSMQGNGEEDVAMGILSSNNQTQERDHDRVPVRAEHDECDKAAASVSGLHSPTKQDLESLRTMIIINDEGPSGESVQTGKLVSNKVLHNLVPRRSSRRLSIQNDVSEIVKTPECRQSRLSRRPPERNSLNAANEKPKSGQQTLETEGDRLHQLQSPDHVGLEEITSGNAVLQKRSQASPTSDQCLDSSCQNRNQGCLLARTTSRTRVSDDTTMLRDFLSRAQARKAATTATGLTASLPPLEVRKGSPRKVLGRLDNNSPCSTRSQTPSTPPDCSRPDVAEELDEDGDESRTPPPSRRRSSRKRLPASTKSCTTATSFIPVRRADGVGQVKLPRSEAQELAIITRTNTRRNKGDSKFPRIRLETIGSSDPSTNAIAVPDKRAKSAKMVNWRDDNLVRYYTQIHGLGEESELRGTVEEPGSASRRVENLNGTPKSKKLTRDPTRAHDTPRPRRRGKSRA